MGARRIDGQAVNGGRRKLAEVIPLDTPYAITVFPIYACNFKCSYCIHSIDVKQRPHVVDKAVMDIGLYKKIIDDLQAFRMPGTEEFGHNPYPPPRGAKSAAFRRVG
jgi:radical SAM domain protein